MADPKTPEVVKTPEAKLVKQFDMQAVHGRLNHPYTHVWFNATHPTAHALDDWCEGQIAADKLKLV